MTKIQILVFIFLTLSANGCSTNHNAGSTVDISPQWVLFYRSGGISGKLEYDLEYDGISLSVDEIAYYKGGLLAKKFAVSHMDGISIFTGLTTSLTIIDGVPFVATETSDSLTLSQNVADGYNYQYIHPGPYLETTGTVQFNNFDGNWWVVSDSKTYEPLNLPSLFAVDGKKVLFSGVSCGSILSLSGVPVFRIYSITEVISN